MDHQVDFLIKSKLFHFLYKLPILYDTANAAYFFVQIESWFFGNFKAFDRFHRQNTKLFTDQATRQ